MSPIFAPLALVLFRLIRAPNGVSDGGPHLVIRPAGLESDPVTNREPLYNDFVVCTDNVSSTGISVECVVSSEDLLTGGVTFTVNGADVRTESMSPFTINGDFPRGLANKWNPPPGEVTLGCNAPGVGSVSVRGLFTCNSSLSESKLANTNSSIHAPSFAKAVPKNLEFGKIPVSGSLPEKRHESCGVMCNGKYYIIGGRGNLNPWSFDPKTKTWQMLQTPGLEVHHIQCVCIGMKIYIPGAWFGAFPKEKSYKNMFVYDIPSNSWDTSLPVPSGNRLRGSSAVGVFGTTKIIMAGGSSGGHGSPTTLVNATDLFDTANPAAGWIALPDLPDGRDHTAGAVVSDFFCVAGGRIGSAPDFSFWNTTNQVAPINCLNLSTRKWKRMTNLPFPRGAAAVGATCDGYLLVAGGEAREPTRSLAYRRADLFDPITNKVLDKPVLMKQGRHGTGLGVADCTCGNVYIGSGSGNIGGNPELNDMEVWNPNGAPSKDC